MRESSRGVDTEGTELASEKRRNFEGLANDSDTDLEHLKRFILTDRYRRIPWDDFYETDEKVSRIKLNKTLNPLRW